MNAEQKIVFIGAGNMAEALVKGLCHAGVSTQSIRVTDLRAERLEYFKNTYNVEGSTDNRTAAAGADTIVLAVKPQHMTGALASLRGVAPDALYVSIAAGIPTARIEKELGAAPRVVRVMPNTPALVGAGVSALCAGANATAEDLDRAERLLSAVGATVRVAESQMDAVTAVSGSGPAYVFRVMEAMEEAGVELGLSGDVARELVLRTFSGASKLALESGRAPAVLREQVTSKGGTTAAALKVLDERDLMAVFSEALAAAARRARELANGD